MSCDPTRDRPAAAAAAAPPGGEWPPSTTGAERRIGQGAPSIQEHAAVSDEAVPWPDEAHHALGANALGTALMVASLAGAGPILARRQRRRSGHAPAVPIGGDALPIALSMAWSLLLWAVPAEWGAAGWVLTLRVVHALALPPAITLAAAIAWRRTGTSRVGRACALFVGFLAAATLAEQRPPSGWTFTFLLVPPSALARAVGLTVAAAGARAPAPGYPPAGVAEASTRAKQTGRPE